MPPDASINRQENQNNNNASVKTVVTKKKRASRTPSRKPGIERYSRIIEAAEAHTLGLATYLSVDPIADARKMAADLATRSPDSIAGSKALVDQLWSTGRDQLVLEGELQSKIVGYPHQLETVMAQMQKRPPNYK